MKKTNIKNILLLASSLALASIMSSCGVAVTEGKLPTVNLTKSYKVSGKSSSTTGSLISKLASTTKEVTLPSGQYSLLEKGNISKSAVYKSPSSVSVKSSSGKVEQYEGGFIAYPGESKPHAVYYKKHANAATSAANVLLFGGTNISKDIFTVSDSSGALSGISTNQ